MSADLRIEDHGSVVAITPLSTIAREWFAENIDAEPWQWLGPALCIDHRMAQPIIDALGAEGFSAE